MSTQWTQAKRAEKMNPSVIREILKVTDKPGIISSVSYTHLTLPTSDLV